MRSPPIYDKIPLRNGSKYRSLSHHKFSTKEAYWIVIAVKNVKRKGVAPSIDNLCETYEIPRKLVDSWLAVYESCRTVESFAKM